MTTTSPRQAEQARGPRSDASLPATRLTHLYEIVQRRAAQFPDAIALGGQQGLRWRTLDSRELLELVDRLAEELTQRGIRAGDRVVLWLPSQWRTPVYYFALWKLGAIVVPYDREMNPEAARRIVASVEARCILAGYGERPAWAEGAELVEWWEPGSVVASATGAPWSRPDEELAAVVFTSGTTGNPKGCMISHANLCSQVETLGDNIPLDPTCRLASILPLSHLFELTGGLLYPLSTGAAIHYIPSRRAPDIVRVLSEQRISHMIVVPQLLALMGQSLDQQLRTSLPGVLYRALQALAPRLPLGARRWLFWPVHRTLGGALRMMASGGAALAPETHRLWERLGVRIVQGYGTSECSPVVACGAPDGSTPVGSIGKPIRGVQVRLSDEDELQVHGPNVMRGYWRDPERTAEVLHDGWYSTGDLARIDPAGNLWLQGRAKDLIALPSGLKLWPQDVEDVLRAQPAVQDAAVVAVPTSTGGATLHAYLIPRRPSDRDLEAGTIVAAANARLAQHQRLASASWWPEPDFPRTSTLKVRRHLLPRPEQAQAAKVVVPLVGDPVGQAIAAAARAGTLQPTQTLGELGLDSLGLVELALALEAKTGRAIAEDALHLEMTVHEVRALVDQAPSLEDEASTQEVNDGRETVSAAQPLWPYTWGRVFRVLGAPFDLLYRYGVTRTIVLGEQHLANLPERIVLAGTHHGWVDLPLLRTALARTPARALSGRLVVATGAGNFAAAGLLGRYGVLALGLYPLRQYGDRDASLRGLARLAAAGNPVLIYPQGHHTDPERERRGDPAGFRTGVAHLALAFDAAVVPFGSAGTERIVPLTTEGFHGLVIAGIPVAIHRGPLAIAFGPPLTLSPGESPQAFTARLQEVCYALTRQAEAALSSGGAGARRSR